MLIVIALCSFIVIPLAMLLASVGRTAVGSPAQKAQKLATEEAFGSARLAGGKAATPAPRATVMAGRPVVAAPASPAVSRPIGLAANADADVLQFPARPAVHGAPARLADIVRTVGA